MKNHSDLLERITSNLRNRAPQLENSEELTNRILQSIHETPKAPHSVNTPLMWLRIISSSAATLLFCLLTLQLVEENGPTKTTTTMVLQTKKIDATCTAHLSSNKPLYRQLWLCQLLENTSKNERFRNLTRNKNPKRI
jgi:hypothetical protein